MKVFEFQIEHLKDYFHSFKSLAVNWKFVIREFGWFMTILVKWKSIFGNFNFVIDSFKFNYVNFRCFIAKLEFIKFLWSCHYFIISIGQLLILPFLSQFINFRFMIKIGWFVKLVIELKIERFSCFKGCFNNFNI